MMIDYFLYARVMLILFLATATISCMPNYSNFKDQNMEQNKNSAATKKYNQNLAVIDKIYNKYTCNMDSKSGAYYLMQSYIRMSSSTLDFSNSSAIRELELYRKIASTYVSPSYFNKYYLLPDTSIVTDSYAKSREPELVCIKMNSENNLEAYVISYHQSLAAYAHVDKYNIVKENDRYFFYPYKKPYNLSPSVEDMYKSIGVLNIPKSEITIKINIYKQ